MIESPIKQAVITPKVVEPTIFDLSSPGRRGVTPHVHR